MWMVWLVTAIALVPIGLGVWANVVRRRRAAHIALAASGLVVLVGFAGTVAGLVTAFGAIADADPSVKTSMLSDGIALAMTSTRNALCSSVVSGVLGTVAWFRAPAPEAAAPNPA